MTQTDLIKSTEANLHDEFVDTLEYVTAHPELGQVEYQSSHYLQKQLKDHGFQVEDNFEGLDTAFKAEFKNGDGPKIAFLAKYDALPNFDENGNDAHGCGHNWIAAWAVGSAITLSKLTDQFQGTIVVVGSPPEELFGPHVQSLRSDYFKDMDIVFSTHLGEENLLHSFARPINTAEFTFTGLGKQAFSWPEEGINSVDTLVDFLNQVRDYKANGQEDDRINYTIEKGGAAITQVPVESIVRLGIGAVDKARTDEITKDLIKIAEDLSENNDVKFEHKIYNEFQSLNNIPLIQEVLMSSFDAFDEEYDILPERLGRTQLDNAYIGELTPLLYMFFGVPNFTSHQPGPHRVGASHSKAAQDKLGTAINIMVDTALKFYKDADLRKEVKAKFDQKDFYNYTDDHEFKAYQA